MRTKMTIAAAAASVKKNSTCALPSSIPCRPANECAGPVDNAGDSRAASTPIRMLRQRYCGLVKILPTGAPSTPGSRLGRLKSGAGNGAAIASPRCSSPFSPVGVLAAAMGVEPARRFRQAEIQQRQQHQHLDGDAEPDELPPVRRHHVRAVIRITKPTSAVDACEVSKVLLRTGCDDISER